ncbi:hypothetical protein G6F65_023502 [Rhizopus arrhizus]|nr:hypothetical protein G6F65_023502 [Rhizopus arrhizus]
MRQRHQRPLEILLLKPAVHDAHIDAVHGVGGHARMIQRCAGNPCHQAFRVRIIEFAEGDVRPSRDHGTLAHC